MGQVDRMLRRTAYDLGYKDEMIAVLEAEVIALREGRSEDAELLRKAREGAAGPSLAVDPSLGETDPAVWAPASVEDLRVSVDDADELGETLASTDRTDDPAADDEPDLPREGSLRRREPVVADATAGPAGPDSTSGDVADRPAHA
jgi:hypothetical protein